jgi:hypothetical protein
MLRAIVTRPGGLAPRLGRLRHPEGQVEANSRRLANATKALDLSPTASRHSRAKPGTATLVRGGRDCGGLERRRLRDAGRRRDAKRKLR